MFFFFFFLYIQNQPDSAMNRSKRLAKNAGAPTPAIGAFMICEDEALSPAQLQLFKDYESYKNKHKTETDGYYKTYYDPNKTYPQNVTLSSTSGPAPPPPQVVNGGTKGVQLVTSPVQSKPGVSVTNTMPRIVSVSGAQSVRPSLPNGIPGSRAMIPQANATTTPMIQSVTSLNPQMQQQQRAFLNANAMQQGATTAMSQMVNINGQNIRLLVTPQMQSQIQSGARLVFSNSATQPSITRPVMAGAPGTGPRIMYTTTGQRVIQPPVAGGNIVRQQVPAPQQKTFQTYQRGAVPVQQAAKRPAASVTASAAKRQKGPDPKDAQKENDHYGFKKGKKKFDDDSVSNPKFSCHHCNRRIASNLRFMQHIKNHLDKERQHTFSLNDMINCEHCYKRFRTPFERQCHIEKFHMKTDFKCGVCELSFENSKTLVQHLEEKHPALQMPYICKICDYRTSIYDDINVHFAKTHQGGKSLLCHFCLRVIKTAKDFSRHCLKHLTISIRNGSHRCKYCKLMFLSYSELKEHTDKDHVRFAKTKKDGIPPKNASKTMTLPSGNQAATSAPAAAAAAPAAATTVANANSRMTVKLPAFSKKPNQPFLEYKNLFRPYDIVQPSGAVWCCECGARVYDPRVHFKTSLQCNKCTFTTFCGETYANHMIVFHSAKKPPTAHPITKAIRQNGRVVLTCKRCQFTTKVPSMMAWHVASACTGGISFMSFQRMIYPAKEKEEENKTTVVTEEIVLLSDDESEPLQIKAPKKSNRSQGASETSASNENSQDSFASNPSTSNGGFAASLSNSSNDADGACAKIGSALAALHGEPMDTGNNGPAVQVNGQ